MSIKRKLPEMVEYSVIDSTCRQTAEHYARHLKEYVQSSHQFYPEWFLAKCYEAGRIEGIRAERQRRKANNKGLARKLREARGKHSYLATCIHCDISLNDLKAIESGRRAPTEPEKARLAAYYGIANSTL